MKSIKVGGVPEHFNLPWHRCIEDDKFKEAGLNLIWKDIPEGTGAMCKALRAGELHVAVILTEGIIKDIIQDNPSKIIQNYIASPLIWGIHVAAESPYKNLQDLKGTKAAISREGSGSHLMSYVNAQKQEWDINKDLDFEIVNTLDGAVEALKADDAQYFMWEHFTTKPLVENKTFRLIADCPTPWPCFVIVASEAAIKNDAESLQKMLQVLNRETKDFKEISNIESILSKRYSQKIEDIHSWLELTSWSQQQISEEDLEDVMKQLLLLRLIDKKVPTERLIHNF